MGYKQIKWLEATKELLENVVEQTGWQGIVILKIRELSSILLPKKWDAEIQTKINFPVLDEISLKKLLTEYLLRENRIVGGRIKQNLIEKGVIGANFTFDIDSMIDRARRFVESDPERALKSLDSIIGTDDDRLDDILDDIFTKFVKEGNLERAIEVAKLMSNDSKGYKCITGLFFSDYISLNDEQNKYVRNFLKADEGYQAYIRSLR